MFVKHRNVPLFHILLRLLSFLNINHLYVEHGKIPMFLFENKGWLQE